MARFDQRLWSPMSWVYSFTRLKILDAPFLLRYVDHSRTSKRSSLRNPRNTTQRGLLRVAFHSLESLPLFPYCLPILDENMSGLTISYAAIMGSSLSSTLGSLKCGRITHAPPIQVDTGERNRCRHAMGPIVCKLILLCSRYTQTTIER